MAKKEKPEVEAPSAPFWMTTFSDMVTLLMVFFILLLSFSTIQLDKFKGAMSSMKGALGIMPEMGSAIPEPHINFNERQTVQHTDITKKAEELESEIEKKNLSDAIQLEVTKEGVHIRLGDKVLFRSGQANIKANAFPILKEIAGMIEGENTEVDVEGHTDNIPIHTKKYPSNWELSTARAMSVVRYFHQAEGIDAAQLAAVGHGEFRPLLPNTTSKNRAKNRRVEIYIKWND